MPNGFSVERMLELILESQEKMDVKIDVIQRELSSVNANGCAQQPTNMLRLQSLENWKESTTSKVIAGLITIIITLVTSVYAALKS